MGLPALVLACLAAVGGGCDRTDAAAAGTPLPPPGSFAIFYERSGGFAPSTSRLIVRPGRHAVAETSGSRAGERRVEFLIGKRRVLALERGLRQAGFASIGDPGESGCADCFEYEIRYRGQSLSVDEAEMPSRLEPVIGELESIVTAHAIPPNA
jgi:hypothetical protein